VRGERSGISLFYLRQRNNSSPALTNGRGGKRGFNFAEVQGDLLYHWRFLKGGLVTFHSRWGMPLRREGEKKRGRILRHDGDVNLTSPITPPSPLHRGSIFFPPVGRRGKKREKPSLSRPRLSNKGKRFADYTRSDPVTNSLKRTRLLLVDGKKGEGKEGGDSYRR